MPTAFNNISDELRKYYAQNQEKEIADSNSFYNTQVDTANKLYDAQIDKQNKAYEDSNRENAIQKLINERQVAENMANLGLTNSGLNRTQQTAVQLSYANNKAEIDRQKQSAIADIESARTQALNTIEQKRFSDKATINQNYENMINETTKGIYEDNLNKKNTINKLEYGTLADIKNASNGNVTYTDLNGNSVTMRMGANPYTNEINSDLIVGGKYDASRAFSNGYQPKYYKGTELENYDPSEDSNETSKAYVPWREDGKQQQIFTTGNDKYYAWYGPKNRYVEARWSETEKCWKFKLS